MTLNPSVSYPIVMKQSNYYLYYPMKYLLRSAIIILLSLVASTIATNMLGQTLSNPNISYNSLHISMWGFKSIIIPFAIYYFIFDFMQTRMRNNIISQILSKGLLMALILVPLFIWDSLHHMFFYKVWSYWNQYVLFVFFGVFALLFKMLSSVFVRAKE